MYYPCNESNNCEADLRLCFRVCKMLIFHEAAQIMLMITKVNPVASDDDWSNIHIHIHMNNKSDIWFILMTGKQYSAMCSPRRYHTVCMYFETFSTHSVIPMH